MAGIDDPARVGPYRIVARTGVLRRGVGTYLALDSEGREIHLIILRVRDPVRRSRMLAAAAQLPLVRPPLVDGDDLRLATEPDASLPPWLRRAAAAR